MQAYRLAKRAALGMADTIDRFATTVKYRRKARTIIQKNARAREYRLGPSDRAAIQSYWRKLGVRIDTSWHRLYAAVAGSADPRFIPDEVFYTLLEPRLNRGELSRGYKDKNMLDLLFPHAHTPATLLRNMSGEYLTGDYQRLSWPEAGVLLKEAKGEYVVKPALDSGGGRNVRRLVLTGGKATLDGNPVDLAAIERLYKQDFLIQETVEQLPLLAAVHPHSLNCMRVVSLHWQGQVNIVLRSLKFGNSRLVTDNAVSGGLWCGVAADGLLTNYAVDRFLETHTVHPFSGRSFASLQVDISELPSFVGSLHDQLPHFRLLSWDIAFDRNGGFVLIEMNIMSQGIVFQALNGPLFGDLTDEVLMETIAKGGDR